MTIIASLWLAGLALVVLLVAMAPEMDFGD